MCFDFSRTTGLLVGTVFDGLCSWSSDLAAFHLEASKWADCGWFSRRIIPVVSGFPVFIGRSLRTGFGRVCEQRFVGGGPACRFHQDGPAAL